MFQHGQLFIRLVKLEGSLHLLQPMGGINSVQRPGPTCETLAEREVFDTSELVIL